MRLNLQLFAKLNTNTSIVDYLKSQGQDSSYTARAKLAKEYGISNYTGTAQQNTQLLKTLKSGSSSGSTSSSKNNSSNTTTQNTSSNKNTTPTKPSTTTQNTNSNSNVTKINGVDQSLVDKITSNYNPSSNVTDAQSQANKYLEQVKNIGSVTDIIDKETWDAINTPFQSSTAYQDAMAYTNSLLQQLSSGRTSYTDQIKDLMGQIQNRDKFEYDVDSDMMFQQALASAMGSGKQAMQDTIGQASALTGGYGSTYATSAGNQAYNAFIEDAYNNLPEYYQMALDAYQMEGQEMYNQLAMLNDADAAEYQRMYDSWNANFSNAQQMYQNEYGTWQDSVSNAMNSANLQLSEHGQLFDQAYNVYNAQQNYADTLYAQEYQKWADEVANAMNYANMQNSDYWNTTEFNESVRQYNENLALQKDQFSQEMAYKNSALAQDQAQFEREMAYKNAALVQDNAQFYASLNKKSSSGGNGSGSSGSSSTLKQPTETQMKKALEAYNSGGDAALNQYVDSLGSNVDMESIANYVDSYGSYTEPLTYTVIDDGGVNWFFGVDNNVKVQDQYGKTYKLSDLKKNDKDLAKELSKLKKGQSYTVK